MKLVLALDKNNGIGMLNGDLPWKLPSDLKRFKSLTTNQNVIMGRSTFTTLGRPLGLPNRTNWVITSKPDIEWPVRCISINDLTAIRNPYVIGGARLADTLLNGHGLFEMFLTLVHTSTNAEVRLAHKLYDVSNFIAYRLANYGEQWMEDLDYREDHFENDLNFTFVRLVREGFYCG